MRGRRFEKGGGGLLMRVYLDTEREKGFVLSILEELKLQDDENIILIDACNNKPSASNVK